MKLLDNYKEILQQIHEYFGYKEDWRVYPLQDSREFYWRISPFADVGFARSTKELEDEEGDYYSEKIFCCRFLNKWVYRGPEFTMILVDTHTDGNKFLRIFSNDKEIIYETTSN